MKITGSFKAPMGCRSFLNGWIDPDTGEDIEDSRLNLGVSYREYSSYCFGISR